MKFNFRTNAGALSTTPKLCRLLIEYLDRLHPGVVVDVATLSNDIKRCRDRISGTSNHPSLAAYRHKISGKGWFGNPRTIAALRKKFP